MILIFKVYYLNWQESRKESSQLLFTNKHQMSQQQVPIVADEFVFSYVNVHAEYQPIIWNDHHAIKKH